MEVDQTFRVIPSLESIFCFIHVNIYPVLSHRHLVMCWGYIRKQKKRSLPTRSTAGENAQKRKEKI